MKLSADKEAEIKRQHWGEGMPVGSIARQMGVHHTTVQRVLRESGVDESTVRPRASIADQFEGFLRELLQRYPTIRASRLWEMAKDRGYRGGPDHFRRIVRRLRPAKAAEAFLRLKTLPGEQGQVDWAHFGTLTIGKAQRPLWAFVMVLSYSRALYLRFFLGNAMPQFLAGHRGAFEHFEGIPRVLLYDNLKSAVLDRSGDLIHFHPTLLQLASHYGFEPRPVAVARGNEKGRVERAIRYARDSFFPARDFKDLDDLNAQAMTWATTIAYERPCPEDKARSVKNVFLEEKPRLRELPPDPLPVDERREVQAHKTPYIRFDGNDYSIPATYSHRSLIVVASLDQVRIVAENEVIATHARSWDKGEVLEDQAHIEELKRRKKAASQHSTLDALSREVPAAQGFLQEFLKHGGNVGRATQSLWQLAQTYGAEALQQALVEAQKQDRIRVGDVKILLDRRRHPEQPPVRVPLTVDSKIAGKQVQFTPLDQYGHLTRRPS
jgi:transposase